MSITTPIKSPTAECDSCWDESKPSRKRLFRHEGTPGARTEGESRMTITTPVKSPDSRTPLPPSTGIARAEAQVAQWLAAHSITLLRNQPRPGVPRLRRPQVLPRRLPRRGAGHPDRRRLTLGLVSGTPALVMTAAMETFIGLTLLTGRGLRAGLVVLAGAMVGIMSPLVLYGDLFPGGLPTLEGQYVLKDIVLVAAGAVVAARALGAQYVVSREQCRKDHLQDENDDRGDAERDGGAADALRHARGGQRGPRPWRGRRCRRRRWVLVAGVRRRRGRGADEEVRHAPGQVGQGCVRRGVVQARGMARRRRDELALQRRNAARRACLGRGSRCADAAAHQALRCSAPSSRATGFLPSCSCSACRPCGRMTW